MVRVFVSAAGLVSALGACANGPEKTDLSAQRSLFESPYANQQIAQTRLDPDTDHPAYVICNGDRCAVLDENGLFMRMSREERRAWRARIRFAEQNRRQNEGMFPPEDPPETREPDLPIQRAKPAATSSPQ